MQGKVQAGAAMTNQFTLSILGLPDIYVTRLGELTTEVMVAEMSDGTRQTTGKVKGQDVEMDTYLHHATERAALEGMLVATQTGAPGYKLPATLHMNGADGQPVASWTLDGFFIKGRKSPELNVSDDGDGVKLTWMVSYDNLLPL